MLISCETARLRADSPESVLFAKTQILPLALKEIINKNVILIFRKIIRVRISMANTDHVHNFKGILLIFNYFFLFPSTFLKLSNYYFSLIWKSQIKLTI